MLQAKFHLHQKTSSPRGLGGKKRGYKFNQTNVSTNLLSSYQNPVISNFAYAAVMPTTRAVERPDYDFIKIIPPNLPLFLSFKSPE